MGSLIPLKQYHLFVEIIYQIRQYFPEIKACICGKGPEENNLKMLIEKYGLQNNITLTGELPHEEILRTDEPQQSFFAYFELRGIGCCLHRSIICRLSCNQFCKAHIEPDIEHWHIVHTQRGNGGNGKIHLKESRYDYKSVLTFTSEESVKNILQLYNYKESTIS